MEPNLPAILIVGDLTAADFVVSLVAMAFGAFAAASPRRVAEIWAPERLRNMTPERQAIFVLWYRVFGIVLFLTGAIYVLRG